VKLAVDRGDSVEMVSKGDEMVEKGCPLNGFAQAFLKLDVVQVHGWAMGKGKKENPKKSADKGRDDINTRFFAEGKSKNKTKKVGIALAVLIVAAALAAPAIADYSGDHSLKTYERGMVGGGLVYEAVTDGSGYTKLYAMDSETYSQDITISIPEGATVKTARLYNYYTWSTSGPYDLYVPGDSDMSKPA
jgi:hypothetical protein